MWRLSGAIYSGTKVNYHLTADDPRELLRVAKRLRARIHARGRQPPHLDLNQHQRDLAIRYGAEQIAE